MLLAPPRHVVRWLHHHRVFTKAAYRDPALDKRPAPTGRWEFTAPNHMAANGMLHVADDFVAGPDWPRTLWQWHCPTSPTSAQMLTYAGYLAPPNLFSLGQRDGEIWLQLLPTEGAWTGYPERRGFDVAPLRVGQPLRVAINARTWHGLSSRHATRYYEWDFVVEYLGQFGSCVAGTAPQAEVIDVDGLKLIDLRKELF